jgi:hypothetical protein
MEVTLTLERTTRSYAVYKDHTREAGTIVYVPRDDERIPDTITVTVDTEN